MNSSSLRLLSLFVAVALLSPAARAAPRPRENPVPGQKTSAKSTKSAAASRARKKAVPKPADVAWKSAQESHQALKKDPRRRKFRDQWVEVADKYSAVANRFPASPRAPEALYESAKLYSTLARISLSKRDLRRALSDFNRLARQYPRSRLADDARLEGARILRDRLDEPKRAETELATVAASKGDKAGVARGELAELRKAPPPPSTPKIEPPDDEEASPPSDLPPSDRIRKVVIDPGHGGRDWGTKTSKGTLIEKNVNLRLAKAVQRRLEAAGVQVFLTRNTDAAMGLEDRTRFANKMRADLFMSLHCNWAKNANARGIEIYTLNRESDKYSRRLAKRENNERGRISTDHELILADVFSMVHAETSTRIASRVREEVLKTALGTDDRGLKRSLFYVLIGARMPALLVEAGFLSNSEDAALLSNPAYLDRMADAIANGLLRPEDDPKALAKSN